MAPKIEETGSDAGTTDWAAIVEEIRTVATGGSTVAAGNSYPAVRSAIGVKGTLAQNVTTGQRTGYTGYTTMTEAQTAGGRVAEFKREPMYYSGDEDAIGSMGREQIAVLQYQMVKNGVMTSGYTPGIVDNKTRSSFRELLGMANTMGTDYQSALSSVAQARQESGITSGGGLRTYQISNPDDLRVVFKKAAQDLLGRTLQDGDVNKLIASFQQQEEQYSRAAQGGGGVVTAAPNAQTFAQSQIQKDFGEEVDTQKMDTLFSNIDQMLSKGK
jgi:hypothetical protein